MALLEKPRLPVPERFWWFWTIGFEFTN